MKINSVSQKEKWLVLPSEQDVTVESIQTILLTLTAFFLPISYRLTTFSLILFSILTFYTGIKQKIRVNKRSWRTVLPFIAYYVWFALGFLYSDDKLSSFKDLETKFSLLALPLLIGIYTKANKYKLSIVFTFFIAGLLSIEVVSLLHAAVNYLQNGQSDVYFYHQLVRLSDINAAYFSWYVLFSLIILLFYKLPFNRSIIFASTAFQVLFLILLSSRASQLVFVFGIIPFTFYYFRSSYKKKSYQILALLYLAVIVTSAIQPELINKRFEELNVKHAGQAFLPKYDHHSYEFNDLSTRLFFWRVGLENISSSNALIGVGNGDVNQLQNQKMHELGIKNIYNKEKPSDFLNMNLHNMYLQTLLASGIIGLVFLLSILFLPIILAIRSKNLILLLFQLISILFMMHESALQTQAGVVFYSFFSVLLIKHTNVKIPIYLSHKEKVKPQKTEGTQNFLQRTFDIIVSIIVLIPFTLFVLPICAVLIKLSSPGPVFFVQKRSGYNRKIFHCYKLRTMKVNKQADYKQASENDKRITKVGYFFRVLHIDELPQLYNVLAGDMSIIGPRPHMLYHTKIYSERIPYYDLRLKAKPGLTGLAQIKGYVGEINHQTDLKKRVLNDIYYVKKSSWKLNLFILLMTLKSGFEKLFAFKNRKAI